MFKCKHFCHHHSNDFYLFVDYSKCRFPAIWSVILRRTSQTCIHLLCCTSGPHKQPTTCPLHGHQIEPLACPRDVTRYPINQCIQHYYKCLLASQTRSPIKAEFRIFKMTASFVRMIDQSQIQLVHVDIALWYNFFLCMTSKISHIVPDGVISPTPAPKAQWILIFSHQKACVAALINAQWAHLLSDNPHVFGQLVCSTAK